MCRNALRHVVPIPLSLDDNDEAANRPPPATGIEDRLDVVKSLIRIASIYREVLVLYYFGDRLAYPPLTETICRSCRSLPMLK